MEFTNFWVENFGFDSRENSDREDDDFDEHEYIKYISNYNERPFDLINSSIGGPTKH